MRYVMGASMAPLLAVVFLAGCPKSGPVPMAQAPSLAPSANVYLRNSFDTDPSAYVGRFIPEGLLNLDESAGMPLACSQHIQWRFVDGGGVRYTELLNVSTEVGVKLGVPGIAQAQGDGSKTGVVRVEYELTGKMIGEIADPVAFNACCANTPDQCTTRFVGEMIQGKGAVYHQSSLAVNASGGGAHPVTGAGGDFAVDHGTTWERAVEFPNPVYFAFKVANTGHTRVEGTSCTDWMATLPRQEGRAYLVGVSPEAKTEKIARNKAMTNATMQGYKTGVLSPPEVDAEGNPVAAGEPLTAEDWCVQQVGEKYVAKVLAWASTDDAPASVPNLPVTSPEPVVPSAPVNTQPVAARPVTGVPVSGGPAVPSQPRPVTGGPAVGQPRAGVGVPLSGPGTQAALGAPLSEAEVGALVTSISNLPFSSDQLKAIRAGTTGRTVTVSQVVRLIAPLSFAKDQVKVVEGLAGQIADPENVDALASVFTFSSDQKKVRELLSR